MQFRNRKAAVLWVFGACWLAMLLVFTYLYWRDGAPPGDMQAFLLPALIVFWIAGAGLFISANSKACIFVTVDRNGVVVSRRFPFRRENQAIARADLQPATLVVTKDSDGDPYYVARFTTLQGQELDFKEGHDRDISAGACDQFNAALFGPR